MTPIELIGTVATVVSPAPMVRVTDADGAPIKGARVTFDVMGSGGTVTPRVVETDATGKASAAWTLGSRAATGYKIGAQVANLASVVFSAVAAAGPVARIDAADGNSQTGAPNSPLPRPITVKVADAFANPIAAAPVSFDVISGGGTIERATAISDSSGLATSGPWTLGAWVGQQKVRARVAGLDVVFTADALEFAPGQQQLVFRSSVDYQIYVTDIPGAGPRRLTNGGRNLSPAWSPDGRRIAFAIDQTAPGERLLTGAVLYLMNADGSNVVRRAAGFHSPAWSPDGRRLAVARHDCIYHCALYVLSADDDGTPPVFLDTLAGYPAWSPDGKQIAFVSLSGDDGYHALHVMNADGASTKVIVPRDRDAIDRPTWSPDGRRIAFGKWLEGKSNIFVVNADGSEVRRLTNAGTMAGPAWSPDGKWIAVSLWTYSGRDVSVSLAYIPADGGVPRIVVSGGSAPSWRP